MIITLKGATATKHLGGLNFYSIIVNKSSGVTVTLSKTTVEKAAASSTTVTGTLTVAEGYTLSSVKIMMGTTDKTSAWYNASTGAITISGISANVVITAVATSNSGSGEEDEPTNYTFAINPTPSNATVTLTATGHTQSGNTITVPNGTTVSWRVSASGYTEQTGTWTANGSDENKSVVLVASSGGGGTSSDSVDLTTLSNVKTSDVTYTGSTGTFTGTSTSSIVGSAGKVGTGLTFIVQEPLTAGMEVEVAVVDTSKKNFVLGLNNNNTMESLAETATYSGKVLATPVNLYIDPASSNTIMSFQSGGEALVKPKCTGDGAIITRSAEEVTYTVVFKRDNSGTITAWQDGKQVIPPVDASSNNAGLTTQWNTLNSVANVYLCGHGVTTSVSCKINYFGKLR